MRRARHSTVKIPEGYHFDGVTPDLIKRTVRVEFSIAGVVLREAHDGIQN